MKERPILFNGDMVRAILDGRKTQTRRALSPQPDTVQRALIGPLNGAGNLLVCKYGQPGDRLWVRETFAFSRLYSLCAPRDVPRGSEVFYRASMDDRDWEKLHSNSHPSVHMPRWASRITLEIAAVRVERLQDISEADAVAEGLHYHSDMYGYRLYGKYSGIGPTDDVGALDAFRSLWESINGPDSWDANPWVWVIEFKRVEAPARTEEVGL